MKVSINEAIATNGRRTLLCLLGSVSSVLDCGDVTCLRLFKSVYLAFALSRAHYLNILTVQHDVMKEDKP